MLLSSVGIEVDLPAGWDGQVRPASSASQGAVSAAAAADSGVVLHAASFPLPSSRGDYGSGAVELMGGSDVFVCLLEHEPELVDSPLFAPTRVPRLTPELFSPQSMQRAMPGMAGCQQFFQMSGRPLCLYVVVGSWVTRGPLVRLADRVTSSIRAAPRG